MRIITVTVICATVAVALSVGAGVLSAQAMISYGHGVATAAGAGAAAGAGIGGILTRMGNPLSRAANPDRRPSSGSRVAAQRQVVPQRRQNISWDLGPSRFGDPVPMALVGGIQATGVAAENWQPTLLAPSENLAVLSVQWGGLSTSSDSDVGVEAGVEADDGVVDDSALAREEPEQQQVDQAEQVGVIRSASGSHLGARPRTATVAAQSNPAIPDGVSVGATIEELISRLGRPRMSFRGVAGEGFTDQYIFKLPDGTDLVVYVLDGVVAHLAVS